MSGYVMLCSVVLCHAMFDVMLSNVVMSCNVMLCYVMLCFIVCHVVLGHVMLCYVIMRECFKLLHKLHITSYCIALNINFCNYVLMLGGPFSFLSSVLISASTGRAS